MNEVQSNIQNQGFGWRQPTRRFPIDNNFGNMQQGFQTPPEQIPIDTGNTVQLDPNQFSGMKPPVPFTIPGGTPGPTSPPPQFLGPPIRPNQQGFGWRRG